MKVIAIKSGIHSGGRVINFIEQIFENKGIRTKRIAPTQAIIYDKSKKVYLKEYIERIASENTPDLLILQITSQGLKRNIYRNLICHILLVLNDTIDYSAQKSLNGKLGIQVIKKVDACYAIIPDVYKKIDKHYITYGWNKEASISASSVQIEPEGKMYLQCCIQSPIISLKGETIQSDQEFSIKCQHTNIEDALAGLITMMVYGEDNPLDGYELI